MRAFLRALKEFIKEVLWAVAAILLFLMIFYLAVFYIALIIAFGGHIPI